MMRNWILRLHLAKDAKPENLTLNGKLISIESPEVAMITESESGPQAMPFMGAGSKHAPLSGPVLEIKITQSDLTLSQRVQFELGN